MIHKFLLFLSTDFDLEKEKVVLDEQGLRIAENQENSQKNRRKLAENTRGINYTSLNN
jgi:homeobox protein cut-like